MIVTSWRNTIHRDQFYIYPYLILPQYQVTQIVPVGLFYIARLLFM